MAKLDRRSFLKKGAAAALGGAAGLSAACSNQDSQSGGAAAVLGGPKFSWRMVTTWSSTLPVLSEGAKLFAQWVGEMSADRLTIRVYGDKELVPALQVFDAVSSGTAEMGHGASYYWQGKVPASPFFCTIPFGMNGQQMNAWLLAGDGLKLWEELYANYNLVPIPCGNTGVQMGGWFNKRIDTLSDLKGLKMRIPGLGARVIKLAGGSAQLSPGAEIYTNLERGVIDATEWIGPYHDYIMGFPRVAKYYYYPGWHEPGSVLELMINKQAYESLPGDLQAIVRSAALRANHWMLCEFEAKNLIYLEKIREEFKTEILAFPEEVLAALKVYAKQAIEELISDDPMSKKIYENYRAFHQRVSRWGEITEKVYYQER